MNKLPEVYEVLEMAHEYLLYVHLFILLMGLMPMISPDSQRNI